MACGTPVVASDRGSLAEACGDAALYVDPESEASIMTGVESVLNSPERADDLREKGFANVKRFSWRAWTNGHWKVFKEALTGGSQ